MNRLQEAGSARDVGLADRMKEDDPRLWEDVISTQKLIDLARSLGRDYVDRVSVERLEGLLRRAAGFKILRAALADIEERCGASRQ